MISIGTDGDGYVEISACSDDTAGFAPEPHRMDVREAMRYSEELANAARKAIVEKTLKDLRDKYRFQKGWRTAVEEEIERLFAVAPKYGMEILLPPE